MKFETGLSFAQELDAADPLKSLEINSLSLKLMINRKFIF